MNLAIEYVLRTGVLQKMLEIPCSIFLKHIETDQLLIITIQNCFGKPDLIVIKHWHIELSDRNSILPPFDEYVDSYSSLFHNEHIFLPNYRLFTYSVEPYVTGSKQSADYPYAVLQEKRYNECLTHFFYSKKHETKKYNFLWFKFANIFFNKNKITNDVGIMQSIVYKNHPAIWKKWLTWTKYLLFTNGAASELVFYKFFPKTSLDSLLDIDNFFQQF